MNKKHVFKTVFKTHPMFKTCQPWRTRSIEADMARPQWHFGYDNITPGLERGENIGKRCF